MNRPRVTTKCPADAYASTGERIIEFSSGTSQETMRGGLISFREVDGELIVNVYRTDPGVKVVHSAS